MADETQVTDEMIAEVLRLDRASTPGPWGNPLVQDGELLPDGNGYLGDWEPDNLSVVRLAGRENAEQNVADCDRPVDAALHEARGGLWMGRYPGLDPAIGEICGDAFSSNWGTARAGEMELRPCLPDGTPCAWLVP